MKNYRLSGGFFTGEIIEADHWIGGYVTEAPPGDPPEGMQWAWIDRAWVAMTPPPPAPPPQPSPREAMRLQWITLPVAVRAAFANSYAQVNIALDQGDKELALYIIDMTVVPPELEPMKAQLRAMTEAV